MRRFNLYCCSQYRSFNSSLRRYQSIDACSSTDITPRIVNVPQGGKLVLNLDKVSQSNIRITSAWQDCIVINRINKSADLLVDVDEDAQTCNIYSTLDEVDIDITTPEIIDITILTSNNLDLIIKNKVYMLYCMFCLSIFY